ncbi:MAG: flagellar biosynthetic protein FliR [Roseibaca calidilacus]|uniref:Flagellar biosynthetic protein FliR n=1 Tax=Roseibaca calidilacus TaxID=1666912 RepID=A0A0P7YX93_9RHOB|nr:flagellar biosynthetic protein FliR [Roseibaca calidilacus]KPP95550.1 MAG: flagellar biosynthetic protein FliR [Roseibaca calidilacus]CUX82108.1 flagellar biosynthetic protein FliR [Roseibaca calidilacus]
MEGAVVTLPGLDLASMADLLAAQLFAMLRIGAFLIASPAFGGRFVPLPVRIVAAVCLSLVVPQLYDMPDADSLAALSAIPLVLAEIAVGVVAGLVLTILFAAASIAGDQIANAAGLGFAVQLDPTAAGQSPVLAQFFSLALLLVFLGMNGHLMALRIMLDSYASFPPGAELDIAALSRAGIMAGASMFALAASLMLPVVAGLVVLNLSVGVLTRSAPQMNLFSVGFPLTILIMFFLLWLAAPEMFLGFANLANDSLTTLDGLWPLPR